ncbi:hypothetical protein LHV56_19135 [Peribacillus frigoritolerans]|uniref:hypothetical protein n=1 Tax=Peribacillus frigoritolerans TaxID=450367 RepID=UPI00207A54AE|nr:hypothetical protein [Peribacillus frigoritolerans]USK78948.1 hypothetical protein LHV56_19135 [Peribacillus frigoritolerans]
MENWIYLAGLMDGEGCISLERRTYKKKSYYYPSIRLAMKSKVTITTLFERHGGKLYGHRNGMWLWYSYGEHARNTLENIAPFMIEKKDEAEKLLSTFNEDMMQKEKSFLVLRKMKQDKHKSE